MAVKVNGGSSSVLSGSGPKLMDWFVGAGANKAETVGLAAAIV